MQAERANATARAGDVPFLLLEMSSAHGNTFRVVTLKIPAEQPVKIKGHKMFAEVEGPVDLVLEHDTAEQLFLALAAALNVPKTKPPEIE